MQRKDINYKSQIIYTSDHPQKVSVANSDPVFLETKTKRKKNDNNFLDQVEEELERIRSGQKKIRTKVIYNTNMYVILNNNYIS